MYLVHREGIENAVWETEDSIENTEILSSYQQKVQADAGYMFDNQSPIVALDQQDNDDPMTGNKKRPARLSKARAVMALKQQAANFEVDDGVDDDDKGNRRETKRRAIRFDRDTGAPVTKRTGKKTKAQVLLETQAQDRLERKQQREHLDGEALICSLDHFQSKDCCLMCASNTYRELLENGDLGGFKANFNDRENIPRYTEEDKPNGLDLVSYAIVLEKFEFAEYAQKDAKETVAIKRALVPDKYKLYDDHTGHNRGLGAYSNRAFK